MIGKRHPHRDGGSTPRRRPTARVATLAAGALGAATLTAASLLSCGASIRTVYESDVRFEHCMALDARPDVKPTIRRACWDEWRSFYTFGQTRDRIDYARLRAKQLGAASDFDEPDPPTRAAPDPTSAIAPPPMMLISDAGAAHAEPQEGDAGADAGGQRKCATDCEQRLEECRQTCKMTPPCEVACAARHQRCESRCAARRQGSR